MILSSGYRRSNVIELQDHSCKDFQMKDKEKEENRKRSGERWLIVLLNTSHLMSPQKLDHWFLNEHFGLSSFGSLDTLLVSPTYISSFCYWVCCVFKILYNPTLKSWDLQVRRQTYTCLCVWDYSTENKPPERRLQKFLTFLRHSPGRRGAKSLGNGSKIQCIGHV